ncbi:hypothetical protein E2562_006802 [Oryza meyeriana var. granulata]|uniref:Uncharacterized protein n=1 Tax=Oryza meyeriana var. granulata TaxID=110450 RepID=A0A6G1C356_9ORYZ|nr:hypothetical protein E2562_006802 [Oryza meyeriana var. granulata]
MAAMGAKGGEEDDPFGVKSMDDRPEVRFINRYVLLQTCVLMAVRGTAFLALTWSTVVLLGGFVTLLQKKDFWYLTLISLIQSSRSLAMASAVGLTWLINSNPSSRVVPSAKPSPMASISTRG